MTYTVQEIILIVESIRDSTPTCPNSHPEAERRDNLRRAVEILQSLPVVSTP